MSKRPAKKQSTIGFAVCTCGHELIAHEPMGGYAGRCCKRGCLCVRAVTARVAVPRRSPECCCAQRDLNEGRISDDCQACAQQLNANGYVDTTIIVSGLRSRKVE